jgi:hypothetical protein
MKKGIFWLKESFPQSYGLSLIALISWWRYSLDIGD